jgi:hypothetical protein
MSVAGQVENGFGAGRIAELDGLRGVAIGMVVIYHYFITEMGADPRTLGAYALAAGRLGWSGVDLFFVLSGFLIGGILLDARTSSNYFRVFYTRRFFRIVPIYTVLLTASYIAYRFIESGAAPRLVELSRGVLPWFPFVVFLQNFWMARAATYGSALVAVTWSLAVEEQFYLTLPLVVRLTSPRRLVTLLLSGVVMAPILRFACHVLRPSNYIAPYVLMPCRADALLLGVLAAVALRNERARHWLESRRRAFLVALLFLLGGIGVADTLRRGFRKPERDTRDHIRLLVDRTVLRMRASLRSDVACEPIELVLEAASAPVARLDRVRRVSVSSLDSLLLIWRYLVETAGYFDCGEFLCDGSGAGDYVADLPGFVDVVREAAGEDWAPRVL